MAQANFTPIQLYYSGTSGATPLAGNLTNGELAINTVDGKLYYKDSAGAVRLLARSVSTTAIASATSITPNVDTTYILTQANTQAAGTLTINAPTGTPINGQAFILRMSSTSVQTFAWNAIYQGSVDVALPVSSSSAGLTDYMGFIYNSSSNKWQILAKNFGF